MATDLSSLIPATTAATALSNLVLVSPQHTVGYQPNSPNSNNGQTQQQPPAFLFNYEGEQILKLQSDITDHPIEDNTAINDQWALRPEIFQTDGFIAELTNIPPKALAIIKSVADKLTVIDAYAPVLSQTAILAYNNAFQAYQVGINAKNAAVAAWGSINTSDTGGQSVIGGGGLAAQPNQTKQQEAFQLFYGYWRSRTLFTVQTPWAVFLNMAILSVDTIQDETTRMVSNFKVQFKMLRFAQTITTSVKLKQSRASTQGASETDIGTAQPVPSVDLNTAFSQNFPGVDT